MSVDLFKRAHKLAQRVHSAQTDRSGAPYFGHVSRVVNNAVTIMSQLPAFVQFDEDDHYLMLAVACLHDACEDEAETGLSYADLERQGFPEELIRRLKRLDKRFKVGSYQQNIQAMVEEGDLIVMVVKLADNRDNLDPARIATLRPEERSIALRYERSAATLERGISAYVNARAA